MKKTMVTLLIGIILFCLIPTLIHYAQSTPEITEDDLYPFIELFTIKIYDSQVGLIATRDFKYKENWYAKLFINHTGSTKRHLITTGALKPNNRIYISPVYAYYFIVGMEETDFGDNYADVILSIGACDDVSNSSKKLLFIDNIMAEGKYKKEVYYNGTKIFEYPTYKQILVVGYWNFETLYPPFTGVLFDSLLPDQEYTPPTPSDPPSAPWTGLLPTDCNSGDEICKRLRIDLYSIYNNQGYYSISFKRLDYTVSDRWYVKLWYNNSYEISHYDVQRFIIGTENGWWDKNYQYDNFQDILIDYAIYTDQLTGMQYYKIDMLQSTGEIAQQVYWEQDFLGSEKWVLIFDGVEGYTATPPYAWAYDIWLPGYSPLDFENPTRIETGIVRTDSWNFLYYEGSHLAISLYDNNMAWISYSWIKTISSPLTNFETIFGAYYTVSRFIGSATIEIWSEIWKSGIRQEFERKVLPVFETWNESMVYYGLTPRLLLEAGTYEFKLLIRFTTLNLGTVLGIGVVYFPLRYYEEGAMVLGYGFCSEAQTAIWRHMAYIKPNGPGITTPYGNSTYPENQNVIINETADSGCYFWFWVINNSKFKLKYYCPLSALTLNMTYDFNVTAYFHDTYGYSCGSYPFTIYGDVNMDGKVNLKDYYVVCKNYGKNSGMGEVWYTSGSAMYDVLLVKDNTIDLKDVWVLAKQYGKNAP